MRRRRGEDGSDVMADEPMENVPGVRITTRV